MSNQSRKNKKIWQWSIGIIFALLVISFFVSYKTKKDELNPEEIAQVQVSQPTRHLKGNAESGITLVEYSDFQCPACSAAEPQIQQLVDDFGDKFQLEYRSFPLRQIHPNAQIGAQAAEAAGMQGKFWEMHDKLFENQKEWSESFNPKKYLKKYAQEIGINEKRFLSDLESDTVKKVVNDQYDEAMKIGLPGTPSFVFEGKQIDVNDFINTYLMNKKEEGKKVVDEKKAS